MKLPLFVTSLVAAASLAAVESPPDLAADRGLILAGVQKIAAPGAPGAVCAFGPQAIALVGGREGKTALLPVVAATHWEKGRVVAFGHNGYLAAFAEADTGRLLANAAKWAGGASAKVKVGVLKNALLVGHLKSARLAAEALPDADWSGKLRGFDTVMLDAHAMGERDVEPLAKFVRAGGGLVIAATGWGWSSTHPGKALATDFPGNQLLAPSGVLFAEGTPDPTVTKGYEVGAAQPLLAAPAALEGVIAHARSPLAADQLTQAGVTLTQALRTLPATDAIFLPRLAALRTSPGAARLPSVGQPLKASDALARLVLTQELEALKRAKPEQLGAHPAADVFPGAVPKNAPRLAAQKIAIDAGIPGWHSTGLYAAPGELIRVQVPPVVMEKKLAIRIGCHTDALWHHEEWKRPPEISRRELITAAQSTAANPFGGLIYLDVPADAAAIGTFEVTIAGAVAAPRFVLGKTSVLEWKMRLRSLPAPWAELETRKLILSVPSEKIRQLDDPDALMAFWDRVLDAVADLATIPRDRPRPERIVPDVQISAGYMHSGYPIMTWLDHSVDTSLSTPKMKAGSWGHFHELGHNHQGGDWTFDGTTEVTCNLFSFYVSETVCGLPPGLGHDSMKPEVVAVRLQKHLETRAVFERWKGDPFLALTMYDQLRVGFGWETFKKVFAEYRNLPQDQRPKNDDEKRDQWMVRFSRAAGKNLGPFFAAWGVPTSESARASIAELPSWMPTDWRKP